MKIIQIAPCYVDIDIETGGVANVIRQICLALEKKSIATVLICTNTELGKVVAKTGSIKYSEFLTIHIIKQCKNPILSPTNHFSQILKSIDSISLAHVHTCFSAITEFSLKYFSNKKIPYVFTPHGKLSPAMYENKKRLKDLYFNLFVKKYINLASQIITSSNNEIEYAKALGVNGKFSFIYNGYSVYKQESESTLCLYNLKPKSYLLYLGYLEPRKQPDLLIKAYKKSKASEKFKLVLAGPDSYGYQQSLEKIITSLNLEIGVDVILTGRVVGQNKWDLLKNAKGLFLPSKGEGWPVVIAEAIGAEIPSVITKECNFSEIETMKLGIEVKNHSEEEWTNAIDEICFNVHVNEEFKKNLSLSKDFFSWPQITQKLINSYISIINESGIR